MSTDAVATEISTVGARPVERSETVAVGAADELTGPAVVGVEADGIRALLASDGGRIASIIAHGCELLARTPWADEPADGWRMTSSNAEWHRRYPGGWHLLAPAAGDPSPDATVEQPFHGEAAWLTWRLRRIDAATAVAEVRLRTTPLRIVRTLHVDAGALSITTRIVNEGSDEQRIVWVEHPALDGALFDDAELDLDGSALPVVAAPGSAFADHAAADGAVTLRSRSGGIDLRMLWDAELLPRLYVWQERRGSAGFPWWGQVDAVGVEPASDAYGTATLGSGSVRIPAGAEQESRVLWEISPHG